MKSFLASILFLTCLALSGQAPTYDEMNIEADSTTSVYKAAGKNYVLVRSKRGNSGLNKTASADAIVNAEVSEIVLVFTEMDAAAMETREEANRERWENLLMTYPEFFQYSTSFKNVCQCNSKGDPEALKAAQGFYVYVNGEVPKVEEPKAPEPPATVKTEAPATAKPVKTEEKKQAEKETAASGHTEKAKHEPPVEKENHNTHEAPAVVTDTHEESTAVSETETPKAAPKKKAPGAPKGRKSKNPKACRTACYEGGDDDLFAFFKNNIKLSKKQKRKAKSAVVMVKIQLDPEGVVKKSTITGDHEMFNKMAEDAIKSMSNWNAAVKNGMAVKSEVKFLLKFDRETKSFKPSDIMVNPKLGPKCKCASDSEIFGD